MDRRKVRVPKRKERTDILQITNPQPVEVKVTRTNSQQTHPTDINNNQTRFIAHPVNVVTITTTEPTPMFQSFHIDLPLVSLCFGVIQVVLYLIKEQIGVTNEEIVYVSWKTVVTNGEVWRLLYAHFFHFGKVHAFFNVVTLMSIGRFLEKKIQPMAYTILVIVMAAISNLLYIFLNGMLCSGPMTEYTVGFSTAMFSLRMIHIFTMDSEANNGKGDPNLIFGFFPMHLPPAISPWQPVIETIFFDIVVIERCVAATVSGMCAGLLFPFLMKHYRSYIMIPRNPPPPPPKHQSRQMNNQNLQDQTNNNNDGPGSDPNGNDHDHND